jgi:GT2 family glycosyltransferase
MRNTPELSIVIVNWKSVNFLEKCLNSIYSNAAKVPFEVIVYDNASFDGSEAMVRSRFPSVQFIQGDQNVGFAQANNLAFQHSAGSYILFLNPDTELKEHSLNELCECMKHFPRAGVVGALLLNSDLTVQDSCVQAFPTVLNQTLDADLLRHIFVKSKLWGNQVLHEGCETPTKCDAVSGACLLARREAFEAAGRFTTAYFMYGEDIDLCYKVEKAGWDVLHLRSAVVVHHGGQSSSKESKGNFVAVVTRESLYRFMTLRRGWSYAQLFRATVVITAITRIAMLGTILIASIGKTRLSVRSGLAKWWGILRWGVGLEGWAQIGAYRNSLA